MAFIFIKIRQIYGEFSNDLKIIELFSTSQFIWIGIFDDEVAP